MPKLDDNTADAVRNDDGSNLIQEGVYEMILTAVSATDSKGEPLVGSNGPAWSWEFTMPEDAERYAKRKVWAYTALEAAWLLKRYFDAFGVGPDTDTDDLIGRRVLVEVSTYTRKSGEKTGEIANSVKSLLPLDGAMAGAGAAASSNGKGKAAKPDLF